MSPLNCLIQQPLVFARVKHVVVNDACSHYKSVVGAGWFCNEIFSTLRPECQRHFPTPSLLLKVCSWKSSLDEWDSVWSMVSSSMAWVGKLRHPPLLMAHYSGEQDQTERYWVAVFWSPFLSPYPIWHTPHHLCFFRSPSFELLRTCTVVCIHKCQKHYGKSLLVVEVLTSRQWWCLYGYMFSIYCSLAIWEIPFFPEALCHLLPSILCWPG